MGTKNNPGKFDCYNAAKPDEPIFVLLGRDPIAGAVVRRWALQREALRGDEDGKVREALDCSEAMDAYARGLGKLPIGDIEANLLTDENSKRYSAHTFEKEQITRFKTTLFLPHLYESAREPSALQVLWVEEGTQFTSIVGVNTTSDTPQFQEILGTDKGLSLTEDQVRFLQATLTALVALWDASKAVEVRENG